MTGNQRPGNGHAKRPVFGLLGDTFNLVCRRMAQPPSLSQLPRVMSEGVRPFRRLIAEARHHRQIRGLLESGSDVTFISSFFRSGNTWTRFLLADILLQKRGIETSTADASRASEIVPDVYVDPMVLRSAGRDDPALVKTHETFDTVRRCLTPNNGRGAGAIGGKGEVRSLYLYRKPEDVLVSYYHYRLLRAPVVGRWIGLESFCRSEFHAWVRHVSSYLRGADEGAEVFFMSYERLLEEPAAALRLILRWLEIEHTTANIDRAVANMRFEKLRAMEESQRENAGEYFFRNGRANTGVSELSAECACWIRAAAEAILARVEKRAKLSQSAIAAP